MSSDGSEYQPGARFDGDELDQSPGYPPPLPPPQQQPRRKNAAASTSQKTSKKSGRAGSSTNNQTSALAEPLPGIASFQPNLGYGTFSTNPGSPSGADQERNHVYNMLRGHAGIFVSDRFS